MKNTIVVDQYITVSKLGLGWAALHVVTLEEKDATRYASKKKLL